MGCGLGPPVECEEGCGAECAEGCGAECAEGCGAECSIGWGRPGAGWKPRWLVEAKGMEEDPGKAFC